MDGGEEKRTRFPVVEQDSKDTIKMQIVALYQRFTPWSSIILRAAGGCKAAEREQPHNLVE
jgi:hypothetical protein